ncbi:MerC domain-containing protein [Thermomonas sp.]|uniref:MerC domain-containing protein n=1 Tax=Thermomonas sp. TaxID=1971895 RepID=UPI002614C5AD|nr:MerC domain-containing protein [Thermomonas sp.]MCO5054190.1 MerC domain-containing protein [Thermomonas sp.]HRO64269.1 MerC domain-containing protein [Thermomonas sp.]
MRDRVPAMFDRIGATGSLVCAIHCALLPLLIAALPSLGVALWLGDGFEAGFVAFASLFGLAVLAWGYRRHRAVRALWLLLPGLAALWLAILYAPLHHSVLPHALVMTFGGVLVGLAHWQNLRLNHGHVHGATCAQGRCADAVRGSAHETA